MTLSFKKAAIALALAGSCGAAFASTGFGGGNQTFDAGLLNSTSHTQLLVNGNFSNAFSFDLDVLSDFTYQANTFYLSLFGNTVTDITNFGITLDGNALPVGQQGKLESAFGTMRLGAGSHTLTLTGKGQGWVGGAYSMNMSASPVPVPEPESYAMLLAGLGVMGAIARRRNKA
ncbi:PEP-CTERM sorting domain-containing protein [Chitinimonas arctica]|uniref:PEP-CTERM sorting domain-containing protein n=1 Tax=Chitinimonas arctica TaxID=2594795 RepID=A0A516SEW0_9NEIS|nr:FxDxF family PEP-CTERM protein [Chitinimonas arctica]QDQ26683.1 PEP-CTERM sorting domain-containing protein [Chitinimonas arctica]